MVPSSRRATRQSVPGGLAVLVIDMLQRAVRPVDAKRQIDLAAIARDLTPDPRDIGLLDLPFLELQAEMALRMGTEREDHDARGVHIEPVHQERLRKHRLHPCEQAIRQVITLARHAQKTCRFVDQEKLVIVMQNDQRVLRRVVVERGHSRRRMRR